MFGDGTIHKSEGNCFLQIWPWSVKRLLIVWVNACVRARESPCKKEKRIQTDKGTRFLVLICSHTVSRSHTHTLHSTRVTKGDLILRWLSHGRSCHCMSVYMFVYVLYSVNMSYGRLRCLRGGGGWGCSHNDSYPLWVECYEWSHQHRQKQGHLRGPWRRVSWDQKWLRT